MRLGILGGTGFVGSRLVAAAKRRELDVFTGRRRDVNYLDVARLRDWIAAQSIDFLVNAAGFTGSPNVDACELQKPACLSGNAVLPGVVRAACEAEGIPFAHVSSGCIYLGQKANGGGWKEDDPPNFSFRRDNCSFYSGCKALGEEVLAGCQTCYIWRLRMPFDQRDGPRNYLSKLLRYERLLDARNSLSHLDDFAESCVQCVRERLPFGTYNLTNPGSVTTRQVVQLLGRTLTPEREFRFFESEEQFMSVAAKTPRSNCVLDASKALAHGLPMRPIDEAMRDSIDQWQPDTRLRFASE
ncbi:MAG: sugar nucleotide-binding protein [Planctomycetota bacterium]